MPISLIVIARAAAVAVVCDGSVDRAQPSDNDSTFVLDKDDIRLHAYLCARIRCAWAYGRVHVVTKYARARVQILKFERVSDCDEWFPRFLGCVLSPFQVVEFRLSTERGPCTKFFQ